MTDERRAEPPDPLAPLTGARARPRSRVAVGAAVVLFVAAVAVSAVLSFGAGGGGAQGDVIRSGDVETAAGGIGGGAIDEDASGPASSVAAPTILVHVLGAVAEPGIVELVSGARVVDAVAAAGGLAADADPGGVNLARPLVDGEQIVVPREGEVPPPSAESAGGAGSGASGGASDRISINRADVAALDTLPRIGPALSKPSN
ncbi:SLBB domain-containing protein [Agromyces sp. ZXT2-3]|uniref:SLBB domain-containing protein n=1 Tax=Agromyces sp. ZXT2-3 TaxID=3461152 RepID=UPI0040550EB5